MTIEEQFKAMAEAIAANSAQPFGGAFVIVAPAAQGEEQLTIAGLHLDNSFDAAEFLGILHKKIAIEIARLDDVARRGGLRR